MNVKVLSLALLLALPFVSGAQSASAKLSLSMDAESYSARATLTGGAPVAAISLEDASGAPLAGVEVRVVFLRVAPLFGYTGNETVLVRTDEAGQATAIAPQLSRLPGSYTVIAFAGNLTASDRYSIGA